MGETTLRQEIPLQKRKILKKTFSSVVKILALCGFVSIFFVHWISGNIGTLPEGIKAHSTLYGFLWFIVIILIVCSRMVYQILYFISYFYDVDENNFVIRKGVLTKREITLPFSKITDVYVDQDLTDVALGLYDVHISTPTVESGKFAHIDGLNKTGSAKLRKLILDAVNKSSGK